MRSILARLILAFILLMNHTAYADGINTSPQTLGGIVPLPLSVANGGTGVTTSTGTGSTVLSNNATLVGPALGTIASGVATNLTGTAAGLTAGTVTTNANLTGPITSVGNATSIASQTGTGTKIVVDTNPILIGPTLGVASATSINFGQTTLSTYQEGTFTPAFVLGGGSVTYTTQTGVYTRIGRLVCIEANVVVNAATTPSGTLQVSGLPFTSSATTKGAFAVEASGWAATAVTEIVGSVDPSATTVRFYKYAAGTLSNPGADITNGSQLLFSGCYSI